MLRSSIRMVAGLACRISPTCGPQAAVGRRPLLPSALKPAANATACFCQSKQAKDYALPNATWSQDMMTQYNKFMAMSRDGTWKRLPSYRHIVEHMPERMRQEHKEKINRETRLFLRNMDVEGKGFEYVMFVNSSEKRVVCVFQPGPYLEGPPGFAHGGCIATILDSTFGGCAVVFGGRVMTANLTINYKNTLNSESQLCSLWREKWSVRKKGIHFVAFRLPVERFQLQQSFGQCPLELKRQILNAAHLLGGCS